MHSGEPIRGYRDLKVWQLGMEMAERVYELTRDFPSEEKYGLTSQLRRAAASIPANIAEGHARTSRKEYQHYLSIAVGSLAEIETFVELGARLHFGSDQSIRVLCEMIDEERRMLRGLQRSLRAETP